MRLFFVCLRGDILARFCPLFSGSEGNSTYISSDTTAVLVDAGVSYKSLKSAVSACGGDMEKIKGVLITHEHSDHIKGLNTLIKATGIPVFASAKTLEALSRLNAIPKDAKTVEIRSEDFGIGSITVRRFPTMHDCEGSSGYVFGFKSGVSAAVCTDLGVVTEEVRKALSGCKAVMIEANHNIEMLRSGPYPVQLKMRILSDKGHLSNNACAAELPRLLKCGASRFILGHISRKNNTPFLALSSARAALADINAEENSDYTLCAAAPSGNGVTLL